MRADSANTPIAVRLVSSSGAPPAPLVFTREGARAVDRDCAEECGLPGVALMENAAAGLAQVCHAMLRRARAQGGATVLILAGPGNNGGDGFAAARRLRNAGWRPVVALLGEPRDPDSDAAVNLRVLRALRDPSPDIRPVSDAADLDALGALRGAPALIVDAILGTGLDRPLEGLPLDAVRWINSWRATRGCPVLAADIPTGLDCDSGLTLGDGVRADATATFAGLKAGFLPAHAREFLGEVSIVDIGAPAEILRRHGRSPTRGEVRIVEPEGPGRP